MVKFRGAAYCNLKLLLLYLVVYGHWIEPWIWEDPALMVQYRWIYLVHMPLFCFLTGLFVRNGADCVRQLRRMAPLYLIAQGIAVAFGTPPQTPFWHLWYLLSCMVWMAAAWLWFRLGRGRGKLVILILSVVAGCLACRVGWLDRTWSGSRTVVFFPWFWLGLCMDAGFPWKKYRIWGLAALAGAVFLVAAGPGFSVTFLYHAAPSALKNGPYLRLLCYILGLFLGFFLLTWIPERRLPVSRAGADTMPAYLLHGPIVALLRTVRLPDPVYPLAAAFLLYILYKAAQWTGPMHGIVENQ